MKRTAMPPRTARLARGGRLLPYRRRHMATNTPAAPATDWDALRAALWRRCGGYCEHCGLKLNPRWWEANHRKLAGQGGPDAIWNLTALHPLSCHREGPDSVHRAPAAAYARGLLVSAWQDPVAVPLTLHDGRRVLLLPGGGYGQVAA